MHIGEKDPEGAAAAALTELRLGRAQDDAVMGIVQRWTQSDPESAGAWIGKFPAGQLRDTALAEFVKLWTDKDPSAVSQWLNQLDGGSDRDLAVQEFVMKAAPIAPESAAEWAEAIGDESTKLKSLAWTGEAWLAVDAPAAKNWIATCDLPESDKQKLLNSVER